MVVYLLEFRLHGYAKKYTKNLIYEVSRKFKARGVTRKRAVPHITLYGPFTTKNQNAVISKIAKICKKYDLVPFKIAGFNYFNNYKNKVIYLNIKPSKKLEELRREISKRLSGITHTKSSFDSRFNFYFHSTIAFKDIDKKFSNIYGYLKQKEEPNINQHLLRVTILKGSKILYEYDLMQKRLLNQKHAKNKALWRKTIGILKQKTPDFKMDIEENQTLFEKILDYLKWYIR